MNTHPRAVNIDSPPTTEPTLCGEAVDPGLVTDSGQRVDCIRCSQKEANFINSRLDVYSMLPGLAPEVEELLLKHTEKESLRE